MNVPIRQSWTQGQFFTWGASQEGRFGFDGFRPVAVTGGTASHCVIMQNRPCCPARLVRRGPVEVSRSGCGRRNPLHRGALS